MFSSILIARLTRVSGDLIAVETVANRDMRRKR